MLNVWKEFVLQYDSNNKTVYGSQYRSSFTFEADEITVDMHKQFVSVMQRTMDHVIHNEDVDWFQLKVISQNCAV